MPKVRRVIANAARGRPTAWGPTDLRQRAAGRTPRLSGGALGRGRGGPALAPLVLRPDGLHRAAAEPAPGQSAKPLHRRRVGRLGGRRRAARSSTRPTRRSSPRSTSRPTSRSRPRSPPRGAPSMTTDWPRTPTGDGPRCSIASPGLIERDLEEMARLETLNTGKAMRESRWDIGGRRPRVPLLRRPRRQGGGPARRQRQSRRPEPDRLRADRRVRADRPVELPAPPDQLEGRAGARRRQHRGHEAGPGHAADGDPPDPPARGGRRAARASSTSSSGRASASARRSPTAPTSTSSR